MLVDIGKHRLGMYLIDFAQCDRCQEVYPYASGMRSNGAACEVVSTSFPMCNGMPVIRCLCENPQNDISEILTRRR